MTITTDECVAETLPASGDPMDSKSTFARYGLTTLDVLMCFAALVVMCAYTPFFHTWFWAPRMAVVLAAVLPGLLALGLLVARGDRAARVAAALLGLALVSAAFSDNWWLSVRGTIAQSTFVLSFMAAVGLWALAQSMSLAGRRAMLWTVLVGVGLNAFVASLQMILQLEGGNLGLFAGRAVGLTPNPIELATFMLIGIFVCLELWVGEPTRRRLPIAAGLISFGAVLAFTSTRVALIAFVVVSAYALIRRRTLRQLVGTSIATLGMGAGALIARVVGSSNDALARATAGANGRADLWVAGWHAMLDRPVLGWGAGRFRSAIQGELSFAYVAADKDSQAIPDAHNIIVNMAVDFGIVGLALFLVFCWFVARRVSGIYSLALLAVPIVWLLQPIAQTTLLIYMILLGIAVSSPGAGGDPASPDAEPSTVKSWMWAAATILGLGAASWLLVAEYRLAEASLDLDSEVFAAAEAMYFGDPVVADVGARIAIGRSFVDPTAQQEILPQLERAAELEPTRAYFQARVAFELVRLGDYEAAERRARQALELQPTSSLAWGALMNIAEETEDDRLRSEASAALCLLELDDCRG